MIKVDGDRRSSRSASRVLLNHVIVEVKTTIRWVCAAIFLALALSPLVDLVAARPDPRAHHSPRWLAILVVLHRSSSSASSSWSSQVIPPIVREVESSARSCPPTSRTSGTGRTTTQQFQDLNDKYDITQTALQQASQLPSKLGDAAGAARSITVSILKQPRRGDHRPHPDLLPAARRPPAVRARSLRGCSEPERDARPPDRRPGSRRSSAPTSRSTCCSRSLAGVFTWLALELLGVDLAVPLAVLVALPRPGAADRLHGRRAAASRSSPRFHDFPGALIDLAGRCSSSTSSSRTA